MFVILGVGLLISPTFSNRVHSISNSSGQEQSVNEHLLMLHSAIRIGIEHPLLGVGVRLMWHDFVYLISCVAFV